RKRPTPASVFRARGSPARAPQADRLIRDLKNGRIEPLLATRGPGDRSAPHSHHAMHFVLAMSGSRRARAGARHDSDANTVWSEHTIQASSGIGNQQRPQVTRPQRSRTGPYGTIV